MANTTQRPPHTPAPLAQTIRLHLAKQRLIELAKKDGWGRLYHAGRVADSKQAPGQEAA